MIHNHATWVSVLGAGEPAAPEKAAAPQQTPFNVVVGGEVMELIINVQPDGKGAEGLPKNETSSAGPEGWLVSGWYKSAPSEVVFSKTYPTSREGIGAFNDLCKFAGEVAGLVAQEKLEEAEKATTALLKKFESNSGETPILPSGQA